MLPISRTSAPQHSTPALRYISRDEMNLAEFPLTVLSTRVNSKLKTLEFSDTIRDKNGKPIQRKWIITAADKFGLPTSSDDEVLLGLLKLTVDNGLEDRKVYFTRYELLKALRWSTEGRSYSRLSNALDRLSGVRIKATNAFYDNEAKAHSTRNFGIIDAYEINNGRDANVKPSFFIWSEVLFKSFQAGFIKKLDLDFFLTLQSAVSKRLYRYLDKHFWYKSRVKINLFTLAHEKIGVSRNYRYPSSLKQQLDPAIDELQESGFLSHCEYIGKGKDTEIIFYAARGKPRVVDGSDMPSPRENHERKVQQSEGRGLAGALYSLLLDRRIADPQAKRLVSGRTKEELTRMQAIIEHYDELVSAQSHLINRNPVGFLYRAVQHPERYVLPGESRQTSMFSSGVEPTHNDAFEARRAKRALQKLQAEQEEEDLESHYLTERKRMLQQLRRDAEPEVIQGIEQDVELALAKLKTLISPDNFAKAVTHGVDEKLAKLFAVPDFDEWMAQRSTSRKGKREVTPFSR